MLEHITCMLNGMSHTTLKVGRKNYLSIKHVRGMAF